MQPRGQVAIYLASQGFPIRPGRGVRTGFRTVSGTTVTDADYRQIEADIHFGRLVTGTATKPKGTWHVLRRTDQGWTTLCWLAGSPG